MIKDYKVGDLVVMKHVGLLLLYIGPGTWGGWGRFMYLDDGHTKQMQTQNFKKWQGEPYIIHDL